MPIKKKKTIKKSKKASTKAKSKKKVVAKKKVIPTVVESTPTKPVRTDAESLLAKRRKIRKYAKKYGCFSHNRYLNQWEIILTDDEYKQL